MSTLVFFPWLKLNQGARFGSFELIPYRRGLEPAGEGTELQGVLDSVLEPYVEHGDRAIDSATLVRVGNHDITADLIQEESNAIFSFSELLATAGLSRREYFGMSILYCNRDLFRVTVQSFNGATGGVTLRTRRRDGFTTNYIMRDVLRIQRPEHVASPLRVEIDFDLLGALLNAQQNLPTEEWEAIFEAVTNFNSANSDSPHTSVQSEVVTMNGAFERLFNLRSGRENDLADAFSALLRPEHDVAPNDCVRFSDPTILNRFRNSTTVRDLWIRDFFRLRGNLAHGQIEAGYPALWNIHDHLLLASFVFPLILKRHLEALGLYQLSWRDEVFASAFERLACEEHCIRRADDADTWPWDEVIGEMMLERVFRDT